jgi:hypothetical protein
VDVRFRDGVDGAILPAFGSERAPSTVRAFVSRRSQLNGDPSSGRALVLEPFATDQIGTHDADLEINVLRANGFQIDYLADQDVTVAEMANLWKYNVIYMHTHAGVNQWGYGVIATGQVADNDPSVTPLLQNGSVMVTGVDGSSQLYYGILGPYVEQYEGQFPANSLFYLDTCDLGHADKMWDDFSAKGVGALVTWDGHSELRDETAAAQAFFAAMGGGNTVLDALHAVHQQGLDTSTSQGKVAKLGYFGDGYVTLHGRATGAPTATPVPPTSTATPASQATATATASPTAVPRRGARLLQVQLRAHVQPGATQLLTVQTSPSTPISVRVTFPNGDRLSGQTLSDGAGRSQYSFLQKASEITHTSRIARVVVTAGSTGDTSRTTATYRIGFGSVDVSAEPRAQSPGKSVRLWVHAAPHSEVLLSLDKANATLVRFRGRTGPKGWMHHGYLIRSGSKFTSGEAINVTAAVRSGTRTTRTHTTFRIR